MGKRNKYRNRIVVCLMGMAVFTTAMPVMAWSDITAPISADYDDMETELQEESVMLLDEENGSYETAPEEDRQKENKIEENGIEENVTEENVTEENESEGFESEEWMEIAEEEPNVPTLDIISYNQGSFKKGYGYGFGTYVEHCEQLSCIKFSIYFDTQVINMSGIYPSRYYDDDGTTQVEVNTSDVDKGVIHAVAYNLDGFAPNRELLYGNMTIKNTAPSGMHKVTLAVEEAYTLDNQMVSVAKKNMSVQIVDSEKQAEKMYLYSSSYGNDTVSKDETCTFTIGAYRLYGLSGGVFTIIYNAELLEYQEMSLGSILKASSVITSINSKANGYIKLSFANTAAIGRENDYNELFSFKFKAKKDIDANTTIDIVGDSMYNENLEPVLCEPASCKVKLYDKVAEQNRYKKLWVEWNGEKDEQNQFTMTIALQENSKIAAGDFGLQFDQEALECVNIEPNPAVSQAGAYLETSTKEKANRTGKVSFSYIRESGTTEAVKLVNITMKLKALATCTSFHLVGDEVVDKDNEKVGFMNHEYNCYLTKKNQHILQYQEGKGATCTESGRVNAYVCANCEKIYDADDPEKELSEENSIIPPLNHSCGTYHSGACEPTCTSIGLTGDEYCYLCNQKVKESEVIPALGHLAEYESNENWTHKITCRRCDYIDMEEPCVKQQVTMETGGYFYVCRHCGMKENHSWQDVLPEDGSEFGYTIQTVPDEIWIGGLSAKTFEYTGTAIKPEMRVYDHKKRLEEKKDYTVSYKNNVKVGTATVTVTGRGNYSGKVISSFQINPTSIAGEEFAADDLYLVYKENRGQKPNVVVTRKGKKLGKNDFTATWINEAGEVNGALTAIGDYEIQVTGINQYTGTRTLTLHITEAKMINTAKVTYPKSVDYTGKPIIFDEEQLKVMIGKEPAIKDVDYRVFYTDNTEIGTAVLTLEGIAHAATEEHPVTGLAGTRQFKFQIKGIKLASCKISGIPKKPVEYTGEQIVVSETTTGENLELTYTYKKDGETHTIPLVQGIDYELEYQKNQNVGKAILQITGKGKYTGLIKKNFSIKAYDVKLDDQAKWAAEVETPVIGYTKGGAKPKVRVTFGERILTEGVDYTLRYSANTKLTTVNQTKGLPTVIITGKGNYTKNISLPFTIVQKSLNYTKLTAEDVIYAQKAGVVQKAVIKLYDEDGKQLKMGTDYDKLTTYDFTYVQETKIQVKQLKNQYQEETRYAGNAVLPEDIVPAGTEIKVRVSAKGAYTGVKETSFRVRASSLSKCKINISAKPYTGNPVKLQEQDIKVFDNKTLLKYGKDYVITGYTNNINKGSASVTIKGNGNYGGTKTVKFTIGNKKFFSSLLETMGLSMDD